jgi:hypothetical protein
MLTYLYRNHFCKLFSLVLCAAILGGGSSTVRAQTGVLADGNPPLTASMMNRLVNLFQWSLEVEFSAGDRADLQKTVVGYWNNDDSKSIQSIRDALAFEQTLQTWSDARKRETRPQIKEKLIENFEQNPSDAMSNLLMAVYRRGQTTDSAIANSNSDEESGADLPQLAGKWQVLHGNSIVGVDINSGRIGDGNAMIAEFDIKPDGRVIYSFVLQQSNYGCTTRIKTSKTGRASISGSRITFNYEGGTTVSEDGCNRQFNYTKKLPAEKETFDFGLERKNGKMNFCFANSKIKDCAVKVK